MSQDQPESLKWKTGASLPAPGQAVGSVDHDDKLFSWVCVHDTPRGIGIHHGLLCHQSEDAARFELALMLEEDGPYRATRKTTLLVNEVRPSVMAEVLAAQGWNVQPPRGYPELTNLLTRPVEPDAKDGQD